MIVKEVKRFEAEEIFKNQSLIEKHNPNNLTGDYRDLYNKLIKEHQKICSFKRLYQYDLDMALVLYETLNNFEWFNDVVASNYDFWRYLSIKVAPNIVFHRHDLQPEYYYKKNVRLYFYTLYWYIHLSWQGDKSTTQNILLLNNTDTILQSVERPGKRGLHIETFREIFRSFGQILINKSHSTSNSQFDKTNAFRSIMILHTAKSISIQPELYLGGVSGYVEMLLNACIKGSD